MYVTHGSTLGPKTTWTVKAGLKAAAEAGSNWGGIEYIVEVLFAEKTKQIKGRFFCN